MKLSGITGVLNRLIGTRNKAAATGERVLTDHAKKLMQKSKDYSPVDSGDLEGSHRMKIERGTDDTKATVEVGDGAPNDYAILVHENLTGQRFGLGERSVEKAARLGLSAGQQVGPKFLERAHMETSAELETAIAEEIKKVLV